eukprot:Rhum_TRINITY_DN21676_c0_g2::Rhum_TRINITY_DN21676_c0_g2_i1::g.174497::m.174497
MFCADRWLAGAQDGRGCWLLWTALASEERARIRSSLVGKLRILIESDPAAATDSDIWPFELPLAQAEEAREVVWEALAGVKGQGAGLTLLCERALKAKAVTAAAAASSTAGRRPTEYHQLLDFLEELSIRLVSGGSLSAAARVSSPVPTLLPSVLSSPPQKPSPLASLHFLGKSADGFARAVLTADRDVARNVLRTCVAGLRESGEERSVAGIAGKVVTSGDGDLLPVFADTSASADVAAPSRKRSAAASGNTPKAKRAA